MRVKVLFLISTLEKSGPVNVLYNIIKYLDRTAIEPVIMTLGAEPPKSRLKEFEEVLGVKVIVYNKSRLYWMLSGLRSFSKNIDEIKPDVIHSHSLRADVSSARHLRKYYRVATIHSDLYSNYKDAYNRLIGSFFSWWQLRSLRKLNLAIACSRSVYNLYNKSIAKLTCIQNGIDTDLFYPVNDKKALREKIGLPLDKTIFVSAGSLIERKRPTSVIRSFVRSEKNKNAILVMAGTGVLERKLRQQYAANPQVIFTGFVNNVNDYLQASDYFISASVSEGLPNSVLEAMGCGLPVILSDIPAHREVLSQGSGAGELFMTGDEEDLRDAIARVLEKDYSSQRRDALAVVTEDLNARNMARRYQTVYLGVKSGKSRNDIGQLYEI
jgi:glycosyltransferase involved in cell wall biosynthesis